MIFAEFQIAREAVVVDVEHTISEPLAVTVPPLWSTVRSSSEFSPWTHLRWATG